MYSHACIKCQAVYQENDPDRYYCFDCRAQNKKVAEEIDRKLAISKPKRQVKTMLQQYDQAPKVKGLIRAEDLLNF